MWMAWPHLPPRSAAGQRLARAHTPTLDILPTNLVPIESCICPALTSIVLDP
jgi:hypothetical protein